jgi:tRNA-2-methylthio-N6-dimethylallyladenosine synthase
MSNGITALVSITRGCDNMYVLCGLYRGRERSREPQSIMKEIHLWDKGFKEITLGNVDSYLWYGGKKISQMLQSNRCRF